MGPTTAGFGKGRASEAPLAPLFSADAPKCSKGRISQFAVLLTPSGPIQPAPPQNVGFHVAVFREYGMKRGQVDPVARSSSSSSHAISTLRGIDRTSQRAASKFRVSCIVVRRCQAGRSRRNPTQHIAAEFQKPLNRTQKSRACFQERSENHRFHFTLRLATRSCAQG